MKNPQPGFRMIPRHYNYFYKPVPIRLVQGQETLDKRKGRSLIKGLILMFQLIVPIILQSTIPVDPLLFFKIKQST